MARCGCSNSQLCSCLVQAGTNVTVSGTGQVGNPYVISADNNPVTVTDSPTVDLTLTGQDIRADVLIDPACTVLTATPAGLCVSCDAIHDCWSAGNGIDDAALATGVVQVCLSTDAGNVASIGTDGCIMVGPAAVVGVTTQDTNTVNLSPGVNPITADVILDPAGTNILTAGPAGLLADIKTDCGLSGQGTTASPLAVATSGAWPFACDIDDFGGKVYCSPVTGALYTEPEKFTRVFSLIQPITGGSGASVELDTTDPSYDVATGTPGAGTLSNVTGTLTVTNPSSCRAMQLAVEYGLHHFNLRVDDRTPVAVPPANGNRTQVLVSADLSAGPGLAGGAFANARGNAHNQVLFDSNDYADFTFDTGTMNLLNFQGPGAQVDPQPQLVLPAGASVTFTIRGFVQLQNYNGDSQLGYDVFMRVIGYSL